MSTTKLSVIQYWLSAKRLMISQYQLSCYLWQ